MTGHNAYEEVGGNYEPPDWDEEGLRGEQWGTGDEEGELLHMDLYLAEQNPDYWNLHKLIKYLRVGDETCTLLALVGLKDAGLTKDVAQLALRQAGGTTVLLNILRTSSLKCIVGALQVLEAACRHPASRASVHQLGGLQAVQLLVQHPEVQVRGLAAAVLARACQRTAARAFVIRTGGLADLVELIRLDPCSSSGVGGGVTAAGGTVSAADIVLAAVEAAAKAVWVLSVSSQGRAELLRAGLLKTLPRLLQYNSPPLQRAVVGTLHQCLVEAVYRQRVEEAGLSSALVRLLQSAPPKLQCLAAQALARGSRLRATRTRLVQEGGLQVFVRLLMQEAAPYVQALSSRRQSQHRASSLTGDGVAPINIKSSALPESGALNPESGQPDIGTAARCDVLATASNMAISSNTAVTGFSVGPVTNPIKDKINSDISADVVVETAGGNAVSSAVSISQPRDEDDEEREEGELTDGVVLLEAVTATLWHVVCSPEHIDALRALDAVPVLVALLDHPNEKVVSQVAGALAELAVVDAACRQVVAGGGVPRLVELLRRTSPPLLLNVSRAIRSCARNPEALSLMLEHDGLRLLWSHLKSTDYRIQASTASAICTCLHQEKSGLAEEVRSLGGGIELLVALLESPSEAVLSAACAAIARIAVNPRNLAIMTDYGAVTCLSRLAVRENNTLRPFLAEAIAACCISRETGLLFGRAGAVAPLVQYLETSDSQVRRPTCRALHRLSLEPENCVTLHQSGAVPLLLEMLSSPDEVVQEAAADCLRNIRLLALRRCRGGGVTPVVETSTASLVNKNF